MLNVDAVYMRMWRRDRGVSGYLLGGGALACAHHLSGPITTPAHTSSHLTAVLPTQSLHHFCRSHNGLHMVALGLLLHVADVPHP